VGSRRSFFAELQRRHVYKVGATYAVAGWLLVQVATQVFPFFDVSNAAVRVVIVVVVIGFPISLGLSWLFDLTPQGIVLTENLPPGEEPPDTSHARLSMDRKLNYLLGALLLVGGAYIVATRVGFLGKDRSAASASATPDKSIAVLPFQSLSDDKANAYFAQGIQDEILTQLAELGALRVISRTSTQRYASNPEDLREVAKQLGVENILEGSVQKSGDSVHVNVQLIHAATNDHLWASSYDRKLDDIFGVEGEVAGAIARQLQAKLTGAEQQALTTAATTNAKAYDAYLRGLALEAAFDSSHSNFQSTIDFFRQAVQADPKFVDAWNHLSEAELERYSQFGESDRLVAAKDAVDTALRLQPESAGAWRALGAYRMRGVKDYATAFEAFSHALRIAPNDPETLSSMAWLNVRQGHWDEALEQMQKVTTLNPREPSTWEQIAQVQYAQRQFSQARDMLKRALEIDPKSATLIAESGLTYLAVGDLTGAGNELSSLQLDIQNYQVVVALTQLAAQKNDAAATIGELEQALAKTPGVDIIDTATTQFALGNLDLCAGRQAEAKTAFQAVASTLEAARKSQHVDPFLPMYLAPAYAALGKKDAALESGQEGLSLVSGDFERRPTALTFLAEAEMLNGDGVAAIDTLKEMLSGNASFFTPPTPSVAQLRQDCLWKPLRGLPAFEALLATPSK
jgi:TolB-like protein/Flp pilus assembly protein TadD